MSSIFTPRTTLTARRLRAWLGTGWLCLGLLIATLALAGCGSRHQEAASENYFTSGSDEADQRASQRMAKQRQLEGGSTRARQRSRSQTTNAAVALAVTDDEKSPLYARLGGHPGLEAIVRDFLPRVLEDPRVNWRRSGVPGRFTSIFKRSAPTNWQPTPANVARLERHLVQFLSLATGGPSDYTGVPMKSGHENMRITNAEFDATVGDIKATLDNLKIPNREQKELLSIIESTRTIIVTER
ncbi:MAG: group 1 truncated hemoglobin [Verrucomicrobiales bacterium]|nr:group 1 truncated hemoglobin [Verrucomicrobiales bacterium]